MTGTWSLIHAERAASAGDLAELTEQRRATLHRGRSSAVRASRRLSTMPWPVLAGGRGRTATRGPCWPTATCTS